MECRIPEESVTSSRIFIFFILVKISPFSRLIAAAAIASFISFSYFFSFVSFIVRAA